MAESVPLIGANFTEYLTLWSGPEGRVSKGWQQIGCCDTGFPTISLSPILRDDRYATSSG